MCQTAGIQGSKLQIFVLRLWNNFLLAGKDPIHVLSKHVLELEEERASPSLSWAEAESLGKMRRKTGPEV